MFDVYAHFPVYLWPIGPVILAWAFLEFRRALLHSDHWPRVNGVVVVHKIESFFAKGFGGKMYSPHISVSYSVNKRSYRANFSWDAGISLEYAHDLIDRYPQDCVTSLQYAPYDPAIVRLRYGKFNNEAWVKHTIIGLVGIVLSILTALSVVANLPLK